MKTLLRGGHVADPRRIRAALRIWRVSAIRGGRYAGLNNKYGSYARARSPLSSADPPESSRVRFERTACAYTARSVNAALGLSARSNNAQLELL